MWVPSGLAGKHGCCCRSRGGAVSWWTARSRTCEMGKANSGAYVYRECHLFVKNKRGNQCKYTYVFAYICKNKHWKSRSKANKSGEDCRSRAESGVSLNIPLNSTLET